MDEDGGEDMLDLESLNYDDLDSVSKLQKTQCYNDIMQVHDQTHKSSLCFIQFYMLHMQAVSLFTCQT